MATYKIIRRFFNPHSPVVVKKNLTLEEAQAHCSGPETSSRTATGKNGVLRTKLHGPWFDGYTEE